MKHALGVLALTLWALPANAYVRSRTTQGTFTHWEANCALVQPDSGGTPDLDNATTFATIMTSMQAWRDAVASCGYLVLTDVTPAPLDAHYDGTNVIKFRTDRWCHPDDAMSNDVCYSPVAAGITTIFYADKPGDPRDGEIADADVQLNDIDFTFQIVDPAAPLSMTPRAGTAVADLENTLVHELGHLQGLDHTCADANTPANETDDTGNPPPPCATLDTLSATEYAKITDATMYNSAVAGETKKRSPEADDVAGICDAYPIASAPSDCKAASLSLGGCNFGGHDARSSIIFVFIAMLALIARRPR